MPLLTATAARARLAQFLPGHWERLARAVDLQPCAPVIVALSGGSDSVFLLQLVARAQSRPPILAVHVDHGLRGSESDADVEFCRALCAELSVPLQIERVSLDALAAGLEARARALRYRALCAVASASGLSTVLTGHHADDALETLLLRWMRGAHASPLGGIPVHTVLGPITAASERLAGGRDVLNATSVAVHVVRPLLALRREEVRAHLRSHGFEWREDGSNASLRFARNRVRHTLLPEIQAACGVEALDNLRAFGAAVEELEGHLASLTSRLAWSPPLFAAARRCEADLCLGGTLARAALMALARPLRRRALWRLLTEGSGRAPSHSVLALVLADLEAGRVGRHALSGGWSLCLRADLLHLEPAAHLIPRATFASQPTDDPTLDARAAQMTLPFASEPAARTGAAASGVQLRVPGLVHLGDGRVLSADIDAAGVWHEPLRSPVAVEIDAAGLVDETGALRVPLSMRAPRPGDRFHPLGAPGSRRLCRFLADCGVPREDRGRLPLVLAGDEIVWVAGIRPCEARRVTRSTRTRIVLRLHHAPCAPCERALPLFDDVPSHESPSHPRAVDAATVGAADVRVR